MPELFLHYIWLREAFRGYRQFTTDGREVEVLDVGKHNMDAGPDFFNCKVRIGGMMWVGNVEIHVCASDWYRHGHEKDKAYNNVILHIVKRADKEVRNERGDLVPQCEIMYPDAEEQLAMLLQDRLALCNQRLLEDPSLLSEDWKQCLLLDRFRKKTGAVHELLSISQNNWEQAFYITLAHNFGFHTNGLPFELTAKQTPLSYLLKHRDSLFQLEAMLFGQSGLLNESTATDDYSGRLWREYLFLQKKFSLTPIEGSMWKMLRMRPQNFPHRRIAQFAALLHSSEFLLSQVLDRTGLDELRQCFRIEVSDYWRTHYRFGAECPPCEPMLGKSAIDVLIINSVVPYQYAYARERRNINKQENAFRLLDKIPAENNHIIAQWKMLGLKVKNATDSQAFIHLYQNYCIEKRCSQCDVGYQIFTKEI